MDIIKNQNSYSIIDITHEELRAIYNAINNSTLPDRRYLYYLKTKIENESKSR